MSWENSFIQAMTLPLVDFIAFVTSLSGHLRRQDINRALLIPCNQYHQNERAFRNTLLSIPLPLPSAINITFVGLSGEGGRKLQRNAYGLSLSSALRGRVHHKVWPSQTKHCSARWALPFHLMNACSRGNRAQGLKGEEPSEKVKTSAVRTSASKIKWGNVISGRPSLCCRALDFPGRWSTLISFDNCLCNPPWKLSRLQFISWNSFFTENGKERCRNQLYSYGMGNRKPRISFQLLGKPLHAWKVKKVHYKWDWRKHQRRDKLQGRCLSWPTDLP